jgi:multidrug resistance efflux pump
LFSHQKKAEYKASLAACEAHLQQVGFDPTLRHSVIASEFEALKAAERECDPLAAELARYGDLEPHLERAQARLDAAKASLAKLRAQYNMELSKLANVVDK